MLRDAITHLFLSSRGDLAIYFFLFSFDRLKLLLDFGDLMLEPSETLLKLCFRGGVYRLICPPPSRLNVFGNGRGGTRAVLSPSGNSVIYLAGCERVDFLTIGQSLVLLVIDVRQGHPGKVKFLLRAQHGKYRTRALDKVQCETVNAQISERFLR